MKVTKFEHSCVRLDSGGAVLVIDPGPWTRPAALDGVDAVLITHEHFDHLDIDRLADALAKRPAVTVHAHEAVISKLDALGGATRTVASGDAFQAAGFAVKAYGGFHAIVYPEIAPVPNLGFLVDDSVYHPGDSFDLPEGAHVDTLFVPVAGPWLKLSESVDFIRAIGPQRAFALHDELHSEKGHMVVDGNLDRLAQCEYARLDPGTSIDA
jgi:L-ascorbate metabolism protein UlaG (beta-lactamase superfamily)